MTYAEAGQLCKTVQMRAPAHYLRVDLADEAEAEYWMVVFDTTRGGLEAAVARVGHDALDVRAELRQSDSRGQRDSRFDAVA